MLFRERVRFHLLLKFNRVQELHQSILILFPQISLDCMILVQHLIPMARIESSARLSGTLMPLRPPLATTVTQMTILTCNNLAGQVHNDLRIRHRPTFSGLDRIAFLSNTGKDI